jgi:serine protease Do
MLRAARALLPALLVALGPAAARAAPPRLCAGRYADTLSAMREAARERESRPAADWVYCLRATAVYEHLSYGRGGKVVHAYHTKVRHGTGFAYRQRGAEWLLATNEHVIAFPEVTASGQDLEGVPPGSRRIREEVRIVANEAEPDSPDHIALRTVARDELLDMAVLSSPEALRLLPYPLGRSSELRVGDAVLVRGYPLGAFPAANAGRVIALGQRDYERGWDHEDFAVDALLNLGSSGSPVLAVSCETGEPEVVGVYHAGYRNAQGMNVVIAVDEVRALLDEPRGRARATLPRERGADPAEARAALAGGPVLIPFGRRTVRVERDGAAVRFAVLDAAFPLSARVELSILDRGSSADGRAAELRSALWEQLGLVLRYRATEEEQPGNVPPIRERILARLRDGEEEQDQLLAAARAGAVGVSHVTRSERDPAAQGPGGAVGRPGRATLEVILGKP